MKLATVNSPGASAGLLLARLITGGALLLAAYFKLRSGPYVFQLSIESFDLVPEWVAQVMAYYLPWLEVVLGSALVLGVWARQSALLSAGLLLTFTAGLASVLLRSMKVDCGCFGGLFGESTVSWGSIARNVLLAAPAFAVLAFGGGLFAVHRERDEAPKTDD